VSHSQTAVFRYRVADHMKDPPVVVGPETLAVDAVEQMSRTRASAAAVVDGRQRLVGLLTEQDVVRRIACRRLGETLVESLMTRPVETVAQRQPLYEAVGRMRRLGLRHMPVVDEAGLLSGMLFLHDALAAAQPQLVESIDRLTHEDTLDGLREVKAAQVRLARELFEDNVPAPEIQQLISGINNDIYRRVIRLNLDALEAEGWGPPPVDFAAVVMGSGGRGESFLFPDQDNGFVIADYPDEAHGRIDPWFITLADRMNTQLDQLGFPRCNGGVMAINPVWRKTLSQWEMQIARWIRLRAEVALQLCDVLFDFQSVQGRHDLAESLRGNILDLIRRYPGFLRDMFGVQADHRAALGWFGRLVTERDDPKHKGEINLKYAGTLPLAEAVRLLALRNGVAATGTLARIDALAAMGKLEPNDEDYLEGAFAHITGLQLRQQIADYEAGGPITNFVDPDALTRREVDILKDSFRAINDFRERIRIELTGELF
jgi:CBS domain-containing protein